MIRCPLPPVGAPPDSPERCVHEAAVVGRLAGHLVQDHMLNATEAVTKSHEAFTRPIAKPSIETAPPRATPAPPPPVPKEPDMATTCSYCKRTDGTHTDGCRKKAGCKRCKRRAKNDPCPYHGGVRLKVKKTRERKARSAKPPRRGRSSKPRPPGVADTGDGAIAARVRGLVQAVANGQAAERELASIREAMGA